MTPYQKALMFSNDLQLSRNTSKRTDCPICHGSNSFSISNTSGKLLFKCYRASCAVKGIQNMTLNMKDIKEKFVEKAPEPLQLADCIGWVDNLGEYPKVMEYLTKNNCMEAYRAYPKKFFYDRIQDRVVFVEHAGLNSFSIASGRSLSGAIPKWYKYKPLPYAYFTCNKVDDLGDFPVVIVEDPASACSVARVTHGLALCGTSWNLSSLLERLGDFQDIVVSLDKDAQLKTLKLQRDLLGAGAFRSVKVIRPKDDIKYISDKNELFDLIYKGDTTL